MKKCLFTLLLSALSVSCVQKENRKQKAKHDESKYTTISNPLDSYLGKYEIQPQIIITNLDHKQKKVSFLNHNIEWLDGDTGTKIRIDNHLLSLTGKVTLNSVWGEDVDSVDFANNWDQVKYFKFNDNEIIGIRMSFYPCTGLGCSVDYFLLYDVAHKIASFFGQFRSDRELKLYRFNNNPQADYLSTTYSGSADRIYVESPVIYQLFSLTEKGSFVLQKNKENKPYFIKHILPVDENASVKETFETDWFETIK